MQNSLSPLTILASGCGFALLFLFLAAVAALVEWLLEKMTELAKSSQPLKRMLALVALCIAGIDCGLFLKLLLVHAIPLVLGLDPSASS